MLYYTSVLRRLSENFEACLHFRADPPSLPSLPIPFLHSPRNPRSFTLLCSAMYHIRAHDHIPFWCPGLEVYPGSCSGLPPRSLLSHPGHQRSQFTPLIGTEVTLCSFCSYLHNPGSCILCGWPLCVEWASFGTR